MPFWKKKKTGRTSAQSFDIEKFDLMKNLKLNISTILDKGESPSFGHAIDFVEDSFKENIRPITKEIYKDGLLHFFPPIFKGAGGIERMDCFKAADNDQIRVEKHVHPNVFFLLESKYLSSIPKDKREALVTKKEIASQLMIIEPAFLKFFDDESFVYFDKMATAIYEKSDLGLSFRIMKFRDECESSKFLDLSEKSLKELLFQIVVPKNVREQWFGRKENEAKKLRHEYLLKHNSMINEDLERNKLLFHLQFNNRDILFDRSLYLDPSKIIYSMRFKHKNLVFSVTFSGINLRDYQLGLVFAKFISTNFHFSQRIQN